MKAKSSSRKNKRSAKRNRRTTLPPLDILPLEEFAGEFDRPSGFCSLCCFAL